MAASSSSLPTALHASCGFLLSQQCRMRGTKYEAKFVQCRYIRRQTNIPVPRVYAYGRSQLCRHASGLQVFVIMEQIKGRPLTRKALEASPELPRRLFLQQLVDVFAELRKLSFARGGSLMPSNDEDIGLDSPPDVVGAFSIRKNELQAAGYTVPRIVTTSAKEFLDEQLSILQQLWTLPCKDLDHEICIDPTAQPFFLAHPDLRPGNIMVDDELNICGIIDWEFTATVPQCASAPPTWITGNDTGLANLPSEFTCVLSSMKEKSKYHSQLAAEWGFRDPLAWSLSHILIDPAELDFVFWETVMPNITGLCDIPIPDDTQLQANVDRRLEVSGRFAQYLNENNPNVEGREEEIQRLLQQARATIDQLKKGTVAHP
ncbi:APH domain-containing protein [Fusarium sp. LHS14.1]|nr:APH domain-containing protein [Fusarium sp. LHS14.1]